ncbi:hypothetical protein GSI_03526 [Ganoderma sinense ZZ0214-1]|uniref:Uncharacterized protein n=1 Tax=Ganoderma sinense ZZ0214-1 TaxID=1077348 RepID=A0A2G8SLU2_9APHY|nr:hypothetical protein GSI_03526 [Ganoderma sinense ZZ0214-1]
MLPNISQHLDVQVRLKSSVNMHRSVLANFLHRAPPIKPAGTFASLVQAKARTTRVHLTTSARWTNDPLPPVNGSIKPAVFPTSRHVLSSKRSRRRQPLANLEHAAATACLPALSQTQPARTRTASLTATDTLARPGNQ